LLSNIDNKDYVMARLPVVIANNNRLRDGRQNQIARRSQTGGQGSSQRRLSPQEASRLAPGEEFIGLDGSLMVRQ
jgi:hypothetical protein